MDTQDALGTPRDARHGRHGTPGLDIFKIAGRSISGFLPSFKTEDQHQVHQVRQAFTTQLEERLALYLEYHPHVRSYQRGDASETFARARHLHTPLGTPYRISYLYDGTAHDYLPDFVGTLSDGGLLIAEAGRDSEKRKGQALAKAEAAHRLAQLKGGVHWIGTDQNLSLRRHHNLLYLHVRRQPFPTYEEIKATLLEHWSWGEPYSVNELIRLFGSRWSEYEVEATVWKLVGDAAAQGHLLVDLTEIILDRSTPLALLEPSALPILPDPLPSHLEQVAEAADDGEADESESEREGEEEGVVLTHEEVALETLALEEIIPGPTFDASSLESAEQRDRFHHNLAAVAAVLTGEPRRQVAQRYNMHPFALARLEKRVQQHGQIACVPHATYHRSRMLHPELQQLLRKLYTHPLRPTVMAVYEDVRLRQLAEKLSEREGKEVPTPTYRQVWSFLKEISQEPSVAYARSGLKHPPREQTSTSTPSTPTSPTSTQGRSPQSPQSPHSPYSFVLSIPSPALICQVDEHTLDQLIVAADGTVITRRVHGAVLVCVKTAAIMGAVLSLDNLKEEDYMRLLKQALEPKDSLVARYECAHQWPCYGKPAVIFHDRGKIFTSERATQVVVDRLNIITEQAPPYAPSAKGTVEALFTWTTRKFEHRLPGTTKSTAKDRGVYDSVREAEKAGITLDVLEKLFIQAIVDGYMQEWDKLRRGRRITLWEESVREKGIPRWLGSQDDLKLLLMKAVNRKNPATGRYAITRGTLSFLGRRYVSPGLLDRLRGKEIDIYYDRRDITVIYLFLEGVLVGEAYCTEFMGRRVSIWEANSERRADAQAAKEASAESLRNRQRIQQEASQAVQGRRVLSLETKRLQRKQEQQRERQLERQRQLDEQRQEIHPGYVQATLQTLQAISEHSEQAQKTQQSASPPISPIAAFSARATGKGKGKGKGLGLLPPAIPQDDADVADVAQVHLPVRRLEEE